MSLSETISELTEHIRQEMLADADYQAHAAFRYALRQFLHLSERNARIAGITPQQHLLLLAVRGHPGYPRVTIGDVAEYLKVRHNGASLLIERAVQRDLLRRQQDPVDRRRVLVSLTEQGAHILDRITVANRVELETLEGAVARLGTLMERAQST